MAANGIHAATATMCIIVCVLIRKTLVQILQSYVLSGGHKKHTYDQLTSLPEGDEQKQRE